MFASTVIFINVYVALASAHGDFYTFTQQWSSQAMARFSNMPPESVATTDYYKAWNEAYLAQAWDRVMFSRQSQTYIRKNWSSPESEEYRNVIAGLKRIEMSGFAIIRKAHDGGFPFKVEPTTSMFPPNQ